MKMHKLVGIIIAVAVVSLAVYQVAIAKTKSWNGSVGGVTVRAEKSIFLHSRTWSSSLESYAAQDITIIGYTYWTLAEYCPNNNTYTYWHQYGGGVDKYDDYYYTGAVILYQGCPGVSQHQSLGNHDFAARGDHIYPYVKVTVNRP